MLKKSFVVPLFLFLCGILDIIAERSISYGLRASQTEDMNISLLQNAWQDDMLNEHNAARSQVGVPALFYSGNLAGEATSWSNNCLFRHSGVGGENLFASTNQASAIECADAWIAEKKFYAGGTVPDHCCTNGFESCGHYTQVVWRNTQFVGCDYQDCSQNSPFGSANNGNWRLWVCRYSPPGNIIGQKAF